MGNDSVEYPMEVKSHPVDLEVTMDESFTKSGIKHEGMKTISIAVVGVIGSWTIKQWTDLGGLIAIWLTVLYTLFKCVDWVAGKIVAKRAKKKKVKTYYED